MRPCCRRRREISELLRPFPAQRIGEFFTRHDLDWVVRLARTCGIPSMFGTRNGKPRMSEQARRGLMAYYREEIANLEGILGRDLKTWSIER